MTDEQYPPPPRWRDESTGEHTPLPVRLPDSPIDQVREEMAGTRRWGMGILAAMLIAMVTGFGGAALSFWGQASGDRARNEEIHDALRRDIATVADSQREDSQVLDSMRTELSAIKTAVESGQRETARRLERIERLLDTRTGPRRRRQSR